MRYVPSEPKPKDFDTHWMPDEFKEPGSRMVWVTRYMEFELEADPLSTWTSPNGRIVDGWREIARRPFASYR